jgi:hypothetical protein
VVDYRWELLVWNKGWSGAEFGAVFSTLGIASIMPALIGIVIDGLMLRNYMDITYFKWSSYFYIPKLIANSFIVIF